MRAGRIVALARSLVGGAGEGTDGRTDRQSVLAGRAKKIITIALYSPTRRLGSMYLSGMRVRPWVCVNNNNNNKRL